AAAAPAVPTGRWAVQLGVFAQRANAEALAAHAGVLLGAADELPENQRAPRIEHEGSMFRVLVGSLQDRNAARETAQRLAQLLARDAVPIAR
ncbi:MAG: SPOR domain-containing protein, partial [Burkholderiaceae bacterium]